MYLVLWEVVDNIVEMVYFGILWFECVFMIDKVESLKGLKFNLMIGVYSFVYCISLGKVFLVY